MSAKRRSSSPVLSLLTAVAVAFCLIAGCDVLSSGPSDEQIVELIRADLSESVPQALVGFAIGASLRNAQTHEVRLESRGEPDPERRSFRVRAHVRMTYEIRGLIGPWVARDEAATLEFIVMKDPADATRWVVQRM